MSKKLLNYLVIGGGAREHVIADALRRSKGVGKVFMAPGNGGTARMEGVENIGISADNLSHLLVFAKAEAGVDRVIIGPEGPLVAGYADEFESAGIPCLGPGKAGAILEGSKVAMKEFCKRHDIPTAAWEAFNTHHFALVHLHSCTYPVVIKADGLCGGKGVEVCGSFEQAELFLGELMVDRKFGDAGARVVIEECLGTDEREFSITVMCDGRTSVLFPFSQDHKKIGEDDEGANTGGMGAYTPVPWINDEHQRQANDIIAKMADGLFKEGIDFKGVLYVGVMVTSEGVKVLEINVRFGDPECVVLIPHMASDFAELIEACLNSDLENYNLRFHSGYVATVVKASRGYPEKPEVGQEISGITEAEKSARSRMFYAGVEQNGDGLKTSGGRVAYPTGFGQTLSEALGNAYTAGELLTFEGAQFRTDIGRREING